MTLKQIEGFYRLHAHMYDATRWFFLFNRRKAVQALGLHAGDTVIYVGCGTGHNFSNILQNIGNKGRLIGIDYSCAMLKKAIKKINRNNWKNASLQRADAKNYKTNAEADAILYSFSLSMIECWEQSLVCSYRHLKKNGKIAIIDFSEFTGSLKWLNPALNWWLKMHNVNNKLPVDKLCKKLGWSYNIKKINKGYNLLTIITRQ